MMYKFIPALLLAASSLPATADALRSVDPEGTVTFSDTPIPGNTGATRVPINAPAPSTDGMTDSQREAQEVMDKARQIPPERQQPGQDKAQARKDLDAARSQLEAAKQVREGDRQGTAGGGSRLTPEYTERVEAAEKQVREARGQEPEVERSRSQSREEQLEQAR
jgi:hypothetical protein